VSAGPPLQPFEAARGRLQAVPWQSLAGLAPSLCDALVQVLAHGPGALPAERAVDRFLRGHRTLTGEQRRACVEALFGVSLWRRRLLWMLGRDQEARRCGEATAAPLAPAPLLFALLRLAGLPGEPALALVAPAGLTPTTPLRLEAPDDFGDRWSLPEWLASRLTSALGASAEAFAAAIALPGPIFLRANRSKTDRTALAAALRAEGVETAPCTYAPDGVRVTTPRPNLFALRAPREGLCEVQDEGSQLLAALVEAQPGETVLDLCAGAGGKSLPLASAVGPAGRVVACDPDLSRLERLHERAARAGVRVETAGALPPPGLLADRVLADVPCSEVGALRRGPDARWRLDPAQVAAMPALQREILARAAGHVRPGGLLVYATCTVLPEENERVAEWFQERRPEFLPVAPATAESAVWLDPSLVRGGSFAVRPDLHGTDGFFAALWRRVWSAPNCRSLDALPRPCDPC
jgi:16S rRNA (cytosine967-C5)-methyltransferase